MQRTIIILIVLAFIVFNITAISWVTAAEDGDAVDGRADFDIEVVEDIPAADIEDQAVPLAAPDAASRGKVRNVISMGVLLILTASYAVYINRFEKRLVRLRREAAEAEYRTVRERHSASHGDSGDGRRVIDD